MYRVRKQLPFIFVVFGIGFILFAVFIINTLPSGAVRNDHELIEINGFDLSAHRLGTIGDVDTSLTDPDKFLTDNLPSQVSTLPNGQTLRTFEINAVDKEIEIAPGVIFPAWTFNGQVPGPTLRATEGERIRIIFKN